MSGHTYKCALESEESSITKKSAVYKKTVKKWILQSDRDLNMSLWLKFEMMADREHVSVLKCSVCGKYKDKLESMRNFQPAFIKGTSNVRTSTYKDHAFTEMHKRAIHLFKKDQSTSIFQYVPIAEAFAQSSMDARTKEVIKIISILPT